MLSQLKSGLRSKKTKNLLFTLSILAVCMLATSAVFASAASPAPLVSVEDLQLVRDFGADSKATIPIMLGEIIPLSLGISMLPLFLHKGIGWIMGAVRRA